jgi:hypothetical protein
MSSTHLSLHYHIVFGTKNHEPIIQPAWRADLHAYLGGIMRIILDSILKSDARTRTHSQSFAKKEQRLEWISHEVPLECDASSHSFFRIARARFARSIWNCYAAAAWNLMNVTSDPAPGRGWVISLSATGGLHHRLTCDDSFGIELCIRRQTAVRRSARAITLPTKTKQNFLENVDTLRRFRLKGCSGIHSRQPTKTYGQL